MKLGSAKKAVESSLYIVTVFFQSIDSLGTTEAHGGELLHRLDVVANSRRSYSECFLLSRGSKMLRGCRWKGLWLGLLFLLLAEWQANLYVESIQLFCKAAENSGYYAR